MEVDVAKGRRDWAFSERDKVIFGSLYISYLHFFPLILLWWQLRLPYFIHQVVLERESIRTLCDKLRRERDRAVSELAEALRDSDDVKKQGNECAKENKDLRYGAIFNVSQ